MLCKYERSGSSVDFLKKGHTINDSSSLTVSCYEVFSPGHVRLPYAAQSNGRKQVKEGIRNSVCGTYLNKERRDMQKDVGVAKVEKKGGVNDQTKIIGRGSQRVQRASRY